MYKIGEFSTLSKTTIKALRYYEKEELLKPSFIDSNTGYRFYETEQLLELSKIVSLKQIGLSLSDIKKVIRGDDIINIIAKRKKEVEEALKNTNNQLSRINYLMEEYNMKYEVVIKELPDYIIYYKEGIIKDFSKITEFILSSADECIKDNPNIKCVSPEYCYVNYLDGEYKEKDIKIRYAQAVTEMGKENETIKFEKLKPIEAACIYHKGSYDRIGEAYGFIIKWIKDNGYEIAEPIRERYIDGIWNKEDSNDWLTEIEVPIKASKN